MLWLQLPLPLKAKTVSMGSMGNLGRRGQRVMLVPLALRVIVV